MKKIKLLSLFLVIFLTGCSLANNPASIDSYEINNNAILISYEEIVLQEADKKENLTVDISKLDKEMTLGEALKLLGTPLPDTRSSVYPLVYSWSLQDGELLSITFENENREEFWNELNSGKYVLPDEAVEYVEGGLRAMTPNEAKVFREWILSHKAVSACVTKDGVKNTLFQ